MVRRFRVWEGFFRLPGSSPPPSLQGSTTIPRQGRAPGPDDGKALSARPPSPLPPIPSFLHQSRAPVLAFVRTTSRQGIVGRKLLEQIRKTAEADDSEAR
jgi:hypothetical protein